jgi:hypothetical protein
LKELLIKMIKQRTHLTFDHARALLSLSSKPFTKRWTENTDNTDLLDKQLVEAEK